MAEGTRGEVPFEVLGRIEVDLDALKKSLGAAEREVKESSTRIGRTFAETSSHLAKALPGGGVSEGGPGGEGPGGGGGEGGGRSRIAEFAHLARVVRHDLVPALQQLNPELSQFITIGAQSARTAVFFGGTIGAIAIAGAVLSAVIGKYVAAAKEMTAATFESGQALKTLDAARAEAGMRKIAEAVGEYNLQTDIASGKVSAGFWQRLVAAAAVTTEAVTGAIESQLKKYREFAEAAIKIHAEVTVPKGLIETGMVEADILAKTAELDIKKAGTLEALAAGYDKAAQAIRDKTKWDIERLKIEEQEAKAKVPLPVEDIVSKLKKAKKDYEEAEETYRDGDELAWAALAAAERKYVDTSIELGRQLVLARKLESNVVEDFDKKRSDRLKKETPELAGLEQRRAENVERFAVAAREEFLQKDIERGRKRIENEAAVAQAVADSEERVLKVQREHLGTVESESSLERRLAESRERAIKPLEAGIEAATQKYESQRRALVALIEIDKDSLDNKLKLADLEKSSIEEIAELRLRRGQESAAQDAKATEDRERRIQREIELENRRFAHLVAMGRASVQQQMGVARLAAEDPRRSVEQRERAEGELFNLEKQYADEYFKYFQALGVSTWAAQIESAKLFISQTVEGSKEWFDAVQKVASVYQGIHDQAKSIYQQEVGIAEQQARKMGMTTISIHDVSRLVELQRKEDERALSGSRVPIGALSAAVGRQDFWKTVQREGLTPEAAFARMQASPQQQLVQTLGDIGMKTSQYGNVVDIVAKSVYDLGSAAVEAAAALRSVAASQSGGGVLGSEGGQYGALSVSEDNAVARSVQLGTRRGPNQIETVQ